MVTAAAGGVLLLIIAFFALRARSASKPAVEPDAALEQEVRERRDALEDAKKLFAAGKYDESLARARQVLARSPNNEEARKYAQMAENAVKGQQAEAERKQKAVELVAAAKAALGDGKAEDAKQKAEEALGLDSGNTDASAVRDDADRKIAETKVAAEAAARKKGAKGKEQQAERRRPLPRRRRKRSRRSLLQLRPRLPPRPRTRPCCASRSKRRFPRATSWWPSTTRSC